MARVYSPLKPWSSSSTTIQLMTLFRSASVETCCKRQGLASYGGLISGGSWWPSGTSIVGTTGKRMDVMNNGFLSEDFHSTFGQRMKNIYENHPVSSARLNWNNALTETDELC
jgi:hypothetical protein